MSRTGSHTKIKSFNYFENHISLKSRKKISLHSFLVGYRNKRRTDLMRTAALTQNSLQWKQLQVAIVAIWDYHFLCV